MFGVFEIILFYILQWHPTPVLLPGKSHGRRSLIGYSPWGCKESDTTERLHFLMHWRRKWQPTPVFLPGESQGRGSLVGCRLWGCTVGQNWSNLAAAAAHVCKVMLKILQARLQQYVNWELPDVEAGFRKDRGTRDQIAIIYWIIEKERDSRKTLFLLYWLHQSLWLCESQHTMENS